LPVANLDFIGQGTFAKVYKCSWTEDSHGCRANSFVAVKMINVDARRLRLNADGSTNPPKSLKREAEISRIQDHENLIRVVESSIDSLPYVIVIEYCSGGTLGEAVFGDPEKTLKRFGWHHRLKVASDIAAGMQHLHMQRILHRDLKPQNVLLVRPVVTADDEVLAKVCDFGLARYLPEEDQQTVLTQQVGSYHYMAPELFFIALNDVSSYDRPVDVYSYGIILCAMLAGKLKFPVESVRIPEFVLFASKGGRPDEDAIPGGAPEKLRVLMRECWQSVPSARPTFSEACQRLRESHPSDIEQKDRELGRLSWLSCCSRRSP